MNLTIGKLASACGVGIDTLRYYERIGLVAPAKRTSNGYRVYTDDAVKRVRFIKRAQHLGFSLADVAALLDFGSTPDATAGDVLELTRAKIASLKDKIAELNELIAVVEQLAHECPGHDESARHCPILNHFTVEHTSDERGS